MITDEKKHKLAIAAGDYVCKNFHLFTLVRGRNDIRELIYYLPVNIVIGNQAPTLGNVESYVVETDSGKVKLNLTIIVGEDWDQVVLDLSV